MDLTAKGTLKPKRLVLINPVNRSRKGFEVNLTTRFPPIGLGIIAALTPKSWEIKIIDENWESFSFQDADLVGITAVTANANRAYEIAAMYRKHGTPVVMGGIHASMCANEALNYVDTVVIGEAEAVWPKVLTDFQANQLQQIYRGETRSMDNAIWPRRDLFHRGYVFASIETSRGCPMDCEFCTVPAFNGNRYRRRPPDEVLAELKTIGHKLVFFIDDNIVGYGKESRDQALAIFKGMVELNLNKWWICQASLNFAEDEELLYWAGRAGCKMVILGLEAEEVSALTTVHKKLNIKLGIAYYAKAFKRIQQAGIAVLGAFLFGIDGDTPGKMRRRAEYIIDSGVDVIQGTILTPLPGTRLFARLKEEKRLIYTNFPKDWVRYDIKEVVCQYDGVASATMLQAIYELNRLMYSWRALLYKAVRTLLRTRNVIATIFALRSNLNYRNVVLKNLIHRK